MQIKQTLHHYFRGFAMGCADVVPGVSGGTVALILGIYDRLIAAISNMQPQLLALLARGKWREFCQKTDLFFTIPLAIGLVSAVLFCTKVIGLPALLHTHTEQIYGLFFGLIVGSVLLLICQRKPLAARDYALIVVGAFVTWVILQQTPASIPATPLILFASGMLATSAMLLPGISGSFMLLLAGQYAVILQAISDADGSIILPFIGGAVVGLVCMANIIRMLLARWERPTMLLMIGVLIGSLWRLWPFQTVVAGEGKRSFYAPALPELSTTLAEPVAAAIAGLLIVLMVHRLAQKHA